MRRDNKDQKWLDLKEAVHKRDRECRLAKKLSPRDYLLLIKKGGRYAHSYDCAHVFGAGAFPHMIYEKKNVVLLNRYSHRLLDDYRHPVLGTPLTKEEHTAWWVKIVGKIRYEELEKMSRLNDNGDVHAKNL